MHPPSPRAGGCLPLQIIESRESENGKGGTKYERPPCDDWSMPPMHMSSHWQTITQVRNVLHTLARTSIDAVPRICRCSITTTRRRDST